MSTEDNKNNEDNLNPTNIEEGAEENVVNMPGAGAENATLSPDDQIAKLQNELLEARDRTMRALADAENTRKRAMKDRDDAGKYAVSNFARDLLDFSDNFKRALDAMPDDAPPAVAEGLTAMRNELQNTFERHGIRKIEPLDEMFDANFHEVMFEAPSEKAPGTITQVIEAGYVLNDRLLRAAKVGIAKAGDQNTEAGAKVDIKG